MALQFSVADLETRAQELVIKAQSSKEPLLITQNGKAGAVLVDADTYLSNLQALDEFKRIFKDESSIRPRIERPADTLATAASTDGGTAEDAQPAAEAPKKTKFRCKVCGYTIEVDGDELPDGFTCPICGVGKEMFERVD